MLTKTARPSFADDRSGIGSNSQGQNAPSESAFRHDDGSNTIDSFATSPHDGSILVSATRDRIIRPILEALLPRSIVDKDFTETSGGSAQARQLSSAYLKLLTYAATNNLAGIDGLVSLPMMFDYLKPMMLLSFNEHAGDVMPKSRLSDIASMEPMAETFF